MLYGWNVNVPVTPSVEALWASDIGDRKSTVTDSRPTGTPIRTAVQCEEPS